MIISQKKYYQEENWKKIETESNYDLGIRGYQALKKFLPTINNINIKNIIHLGVGRATTEVDYLIKNFPQITSYIVNDIWSSVIDEVIEYATKQFPQIVFTKETGDIENKEAIKKLCQKLNGTTLIALINNTSIFSNNSLSKYILQAMEENDYFLLTGELYHQDLFKSYKTQAVYDFLSNSGHEINANNAIFTYDDNDHCLKISHGNEVLFTSYKPRTIKQLRNKMKASGFTEVILQHYKNYHMYCALYKK